MRESILGDGIKQSRVEQDAEGFRVNFQDAWKAEKGYFLNIPKYHEPKTTDVSFMDKLRVALKEHKVVLVANPDKYRRVGKTTLISNCAYFTDNTYIVVQTETMKRIYSEYVPSNRILYKRDIRGVSPIHNEVHFIMDEIPYKDYLELKEKVSQIRGGTLSGIVNIHEDFLVL